MSATNDSPKGADGRKREAAGIGGFCAKRAKVVDELLENAGVVEFSRKFRTKSGGSVTCPPLSSCETCGGSRSTCASILRTLGVE